MQLLNLSYNDNLRRKVEEGNLVDISDGDFEASDSKFFFQIFTTWHGF